MSNTPQLRQCDEVDSVHGGQAHLGQEPACLEAEGAAVAAEQNEVEEEPGEGEAVHGEATMVADGQLTAGGTTQLCATRRAGWTLALRELNETCRPIVRMEVATRDRLRVVRDRRGRRGRRRRECRA